MTLIYAVANIDDVSWGNRPALTDYTPRQGKQFERKEDSTKLQYARYRNKIVIGWLALSVTHFSLFVTFLDLKDPVLGGLNQYTIWLLVVQVLFTVVPTFLELGWYYTASYFRWPKRKVNAEQRAEEDEVVVLDLEDKHFEYFEMSDDGEEIGHQETSGSTEKKMTEMNFSVAKSVKAFSSKRAPAPKKL